MSEQPPSLRTEAKPGASIGAEDPAPLVPPDCDLTGFYYMPLDVRRVRHSGAAALEDPEAFRANVLAWCAAWQQKPAGSLPSDDATLCRLLGYGRDTASWVRARDNGGLHGFVLCSDGRLYHPVVCEKALEAWDKKQKLRAASALGNKNRWLHKNTLPSNSYPDEVPDVSGGDPQGIGRGWSGDPKCLPIKEIKEIKESLPESDHTSTQAKAAPKRSKPPASDNRFDDFWDIYPRKDAKGAARKAWQKAIVQTPPDIILRALGAYTWNPDRKFIPHAATWLNGERWLDEASTEPSQTQKSVQRPLSTSSGRVLSAAELFEVST